MKKQFKILVLAIISAFLFISLFAENVKADNLTITLEKDSYTCVEGETIETYFIIHASDYAGSPDTYQFTDLKYTSFNNNVTTAINDGGNACRNVHTLNDSKCIELRITCNAPGSSLDLNVNAYTYTGETTCYYPWDPCEVVARGSASLTINYAPSAITGVTLNPSSREIEVDETVQLTATVTPAEVEDKSVTWTSNNSAVASVDSNGLVRGLAAGTAVITATASDGTHKATSTITVKNKVIAITGVTISPSSREIEVDETVQLTATVTPAEVENKSVTWTSNNPLIASVDSNGLVRGLAAGTAVITATASDGTHNATSTITVKPYISMTDNVTCNVGEQKILMVKYSLLQSSDFIYASRNSSIATIELNPELQPTCVGCRYVRVNCLSSGRTTVSVSANGIERSATVEVSSTNTEKSIEFVEKNMEPEVYHILGNGSGVVRLRLRNIPNSELENVEFNIENENIAKISNVEINDTSGGMAKININYLAIGSTSINARLVYDGNTYTDRMTITIRNTAWRIELSADDNSTLPERITVEGQTQLRASAVYGTLPPQDVTDTATWTSSDESIFTVNKGLVKKASPLGGTAIIAVSYDTGDDAVITTIEVEAVGSSIYDNPIEGPAPVTLTFDSNGGTACSPNSITKQIVISTWGELCTPTREGYDFVGWFTSKTGGKKITENSRAEDNLIVYAQWKQKAIINPLTGIATPVIGLMLITIASFVVYMFIKNKNINLE